MCKCTNRRLTVANNLHYFDNVKEFSEMQVMSEKTTEL